MLATNDIELSIIHFMFFTEKIVPSFNVRIDIIDKVAAAKSYPTKRDIVTSKRKKRTISLLFLLKPGGVLGPLVVVTNVVLLISTTSTVVNLSYLYFSRWRRIKLI